VVVSNINASVPNVGTSWSHAPRGVTVPQYISIHRAPGLSQEEFQQNAPDVLEGKHARSLHTYANVFEGFIVTLYEADSQDALVKEFERLGFPHDEIHEIQINMPREGLEAMVKRSGA
jgi:hypothetical protein